MITVMLPLAAPQCRNHDRREIVAAPDRLRLAVEARAGRRVRDLRVEWIGDTGVVLHGNTDSYHAKQLTQHVVGRVSGRAVVANRIVVRPRPAPPSTWPAAVLPRAEQSVPSVSA